MVLSSKYKIILLIVFSLGFAGLLISGVNLKQSKIHNQLVVKQFPKASIELLISQKVKSSSHLFQHNYQIVNVWASWCGVCRKEHVYLNELKKQGIPIVGLNYRDKRSDALEYLKKMGNPYNKIIADPDGLFSLELGVVGTPETYLVNRNGEIVYKYSGVMSKKIWDQAFAPFFMQGKVDET